MKITSGILKDAQKVVIYGPEGIGKTTLASRFPKPLFIDTEGSTKHLDVLRFDRPESWTMLLEEVSYVIGHPDVCDTLVVDTADWAEALCMQHLIAKNHWQSIETPGYGRGYVELMEEFGRLLNQLNQVIGKRINVVLTAHAIMRKFEQPDEIAAYDRWELKLQKKVAPVVKEWADAVLFANYKTYVINKTKEGKGKATGGERMLYTSHRPVWDAKNRWGLPDELPLQYEAFGDHIYTKNEEKPQEDVAIQEPKQHSELPATMPPALQQLMKKDNVTMDELYTVVAARGYYPTGTPFDRFDPRFVEGVLIGAWNNGLLKAIQEYRTEGKMEF